MQKIFFYNSEVFSSDGDYIIGGLHVPGGATYAEVRMQLEERLRKLIRDYVVRTIAAESQFREKPMTEEDGFDNVRAILKDNLNIETDGNGVTSLVIAILDSPQMQLWLSGIKRRFRALAKVVTFKGKVENNFQSSSEEFRVKELSEDATFEQVIEQLSMIEI